MDYMDGRMVQENVFDEQCENNFPTRLFEIFLRIMHLVLLYTQHDAKQKLWPIS